MSKTKNKPGIHLFKKHYYSQVKNSNKVERKPKYFWHIVAPNGRITANNQTYSRKSIALNGIRSTAKTLGASGKFKYFDHSKKDSPLVNFPG